MTMREFVVAQLIYNDDTLNASPITTSNYSASSSDNTLIIAINHERGSTSDESAVTITSVVQQGPNLKAASRIIRFTNPGASVSSEVGDVWQLQNPDTGNYPFVITYTGPTGNDIHIVVAEYDGGVVDPDDAVAAYNPSAAAAPAKVNVACPADSRLIILQCVHVGGTTWDSPSHGTGRITHSTSAGAYGSAMGLADYGVPSTDIYTNCYYNFTPYSNNWSSYGANLVIAFPLPPDEAPTIEPVPTDFEASYEPGKNTVAILVNWENGGESTSFDWGLTSAVDTPPSSPTNTGDLYVAFDSYGSRQKILAVRAAGPLDPSPWVYTVLNVPDLIIPANETQTYAIDGIGAVLVDSTGAEPGAAGTIETRGLNASNALIGEDIHVVVNTPSEDPPENLTLPIVTGTLRVGSTAYVTTGGWSGSPTSYAYQWVIDDEDVSGATNPSYEFQAGDLGLSGYCRVTATNAHGTSEPVNTASFGPIEEAIEGGNFVVDTNDLPPAFETITTATGVYSVHETYADAEFRVWVWTHNINTTWRGVMVTRAPETGKTNGAYSRVTYPLMTATIDGTPIKFRICEASNPLIWQNEECVAPTMQRILDAIDAKEVLPYDTDWIPGSMNVSTTPSLVAVGYKPDRMFDRTSTYDRIFGGISGAAGEGPSSRGFLSEFDSAMIMAAVKNDETAWDKYVGICNVQARYAMTLANTAVWSRNHRQLRDPGIPFSGDRAFVASGTGWGSFDVYPLSGVRYEIEPDEEYLGTLGVFQADITDVSSGTPAVISYTKRAGSVDPVNGNEIVIRGVGGASALNGNVYYIRNRNLTNGTFNISVTSSGALVDGASLGAYISGGIASHYGGIGRDPQHMFNHGYAYWLATRNPVYAISQMALWQSILAFRYQGAASGGNYIPAISMTSGVIERQTMNIFALMLRAKLIRDSITVANDTIFWSTTRMNKMVEDIFTSWSTQLAARDAQYTSDAAAAFTKWAHDVDGGATSVFMTIHYGPETAYMWALHGHPELMERWAGHTIVKFNYAGGQLGFDPGFKPDTRESGWVVERSIPVSNDPAELPYDSSVSLGAYWITVGTANGKSNTSFTAGFHYIQQAYGGILKAKQLQDAELIGDSGVLADLAATVTKMETHIGNSTWNSTEITAKHCSTLFEEVE